MTQRVIKFRAWDGEQMVSPDYIDREGRGHWKSNSVPVCTGVNSPDALMQFTGLTDKNGVEIYEGDIGVVSTGDPFTGDFKAEVIFRDGAFGIYPLTQETDTFGNKYTGEMLAFCDGYDPMAFEIVGNIHESPNLLDLPRA